MPQGSWEKHASMANLTQRKLSRRKDATDVVSQVPFSARLMLCGWLLVTGLMFVGCSYYNSGDEPSGTACLSTSECDDGNLCTIDTCQDNQCIHLPDEGTQCSDNDNCRIGICSAMGECTQAIAEGDACDDGDPCTMDDICGPSGLCGGQLQTGLTCEDGNPCTVDSICDATGKCSGGAPVVGEMSCEQSDPCTSENICLEDGSCSDGEPLTLSNSTCEICSCDSLSGISCEYPKVKECPCNLWGDVKFVDSFPDLTIQFVESFPELELTLSDDKPTGPGQWREVSSFPDFTVQVVDSFPDLTIRLTQNPDTPCGN